MSIKKSIYFHIILLSIFLIGCNVPDVEEAFKGAEYAIPLVNSQITFEDILGNNADVSVEENDDGILELIYSTSILEQEIGDLLPSIPGVGEIPLLDTVNITQLDFSNDIQLKKAILSGDELIFRFAASIPEDIFITATIPELSKNNEPLEVQHTLSYSGVIPFTAFSNAVDLEGYEYNSPSNSLTIKYDARLSNGERIKLDLLTLSFNEISFNYGEGNIGRTIYPLSGDVIPVNIYDAWERGILEFEDPSVTFTVTQSFGFPLSVFITRLDINTIDQEVKSLNGINVKTEIPLSYPELDEVGAQKETQIVFDKSNSNINTLFNEKVNKILFNVEAILNPTGNPEIEGFLTDESFFNLEADLHVPLKLKMQDLVLSDTITLENEFEIPVDSANLKIVMANKYPVGGHLALQFLDDNDQLVTEIFKDEKLVIPSGRINDDQTVTKSDELIRYLPLNKEDLVNLQSASKVIVKIDFQNIENSGFVSIRKDQFLDLRIGVIFQL